MCILSIGFEGIRSQVLSGVTYLPDQSLFILMSLPLMI